MTSLGLLGPGGGVVEPTREAAQAVSNYVSRLWKISNHCYVPPKVVEHRKDVLKILIMLSDTGGGHKASASSITSALEVLEPELEVKTVDVIENYTPWFSNRLYNADGIRKAGRTTRSYIERPSYPAIVSSRLQAIDRGLKEEQVAVCGLPLRKGFWDIDCSDAARRAVRGRLGLKEDAPVILVLGGGDGMGKLEECALNFFRHPQTEAGAWQVVVICGKNEHLRLSLEKSGAKENEKRKVDLRVLGFVSNMEEWMVAADVLVSKAGPGTIAEACACGLPTLIYDFLPGQEEGNITFVVDGGIGEYQEKVKGVADRCAAWLADPAKLAAFRAAAFAAAKPKAALDIAREILEVLTINQSPGGPPPEEGGAPPPQDPIPEKTYEYRTFWWSWLNPRVLLSSSPDVPAWWREVETHKTPPAPPGPAAAGAK